MAIGANFPIPKQTHGAEALRLRRWATHLHISVLEFSAFVSQAIVCYATDPRGTIQLISLFARVFGPETGPRCEIEKDIHV